MKYEEIFKELSANQLIFDSLLKDQSKEQYLWKSSPVKWCLLEILCHLYDEEREDFRARTKHILENPNNPLPAIDPLGWVKERAYMEQDYVSMLSKFIDERQQSVNWLESQQNPNWDNAYQHPKFGQMTAKMFLANWLAHDHLHMRQILKLKFEYLKQHSRETLNYAGNW